MSYSYYLLDVFTDKLFSGNQLAVFPDAADINPDSFQQIAKEFNLSETVFVIRSTTDDHHTMRIFTPGRELPTAGHPTIGTAFLLAGESGKKLITVHQKVGLIEVEIKYENEEPDLITMKQPLPVFGRFFEDHDAIASMLSLEKSDLDDYPIQEVSCGNNILFIPIRQTDTLKNIKVRTDLLEDLSRKIDTTQLYCYSIHGVIGGDIQGRMFAPLLGIYEDPATGSANGPLACYLHHHGILKMPVVSLQGYEMGRPSKLFLDLLINEDGTIKEVKVAGKCKLVGKGELFLG
ncbi:MAG: PhzF family phenazine biosynthesis protein [Bacteroidota bacterium]